MNMSVQKEARVVFLHQFIKNPESLMREITTVIELIGRGVSEKNVKAPAPLEFPPEFSHPRGHFPVRILIFSRTIAHRTAKSEDSNSVVYINIIIYADTAFRRNRVVDGIMVSVDVQNRRMSKCGEK